MIASQKTLSARPANRLLCIAAAAGIEVAVKLHIARGDDLNGRDKHGQTPLMIAASRNRAGICQLLLQAGVEAEATDARGRNAYRIAMEAGSTASAEVIHNALSSLAMVTASNENNVLVQDVEPCEPMVAGLDACQGTAFKILQTLPSDSKAISVAQGASALLVLDIVEPLPAPGLQVFERSENDLGAKAEVVIESVVPTEVTSFDSLFGDWEPATETAAPVHDIDLAAAESERQRCIDVHEPIDHSATWNDFEAELPEFAKPLPRADDGEFRADLRRLLLLATREGSVPRVAVEDLLSARGDGAERDLDAEARLEFVIGALGAELDEREEPSLGNEVFKVFVDPVETPSEEYEVDDALKMFESLGSGHNDPLRIYLRATQSAALLTREREADLARSMEAAVGRAVESLARWPQGLRWVLHSAAGAESNPAILWPIVATVREALEVEGESGEAVDDRAPPPYIDETVSDETMPDSGMENASGSIATVSDSVEVFRILKGLVDSSTEKNSNANLIVEQLGKLSFRRPYLARLADRLPVDHGPGAVLYRRAVSDLIESRDEMVTANLRLVHAIARRYFYSGVPIEDLIQEGNIGLMKAVDRFDWRRGLKFSTMATWWIKQQIGRSIADSGFSIRLPAHVYEKASRLRQAIEAFERSVGRSPTPDERAAMSGLSVAKTEAILRPGSEAMTIEEARQLGRLDDDELSDPMEVAAEREVTQVIVRRLATLGRKPEAILRMRMGIGLDNERTFEEIGAALHVTRERVRQIEVKALKSFLALHAREELAAALGWSLSKKTGHVLPPNQDA